MLSLVLVFVRLAGQNTVDWRNKMLLHQSNTYITRNITIPLPVNEKIALLMPTVL